MADVGYPYAHAVVSARITGNTLSTLLTAASLGTPSFSASNNTITMANTAIGSSGAPGVELKGSIKSYTTERTYDEIDQTSIGDGAKRYARGRVDFEANLTLFADDVSMPFINSIEDTGEDYRAIFLQRSSDTGRITAALVQVMGISENVADDGSVEYTLTLKNAGPPPATA